MNCIKCGEEISDKSAFCSKCGAKQVTVYREVFERKGIAEKDFINNINKWFQWHKNAGNIKCTFHIETSLGLLANKYVLNRFEIEYELFENENQKQYGLVKEESVALTKGSTKDFVESWKQSRPQVTVVNWQGGTHSRGHVGSLLLNGVGAANRMNVYIFFKFPRK